jgi:hypothetical protein
VRRLIADHFVPVKVDGRRERALRAELGFSWAGDLLVVRADRVVLRRIGDGETATTAQVRAELRRLAAPGGQAGADGEPDVVAPGRGVAAGQVHPDPRLPDVDGTVHRLSEWGGRKLLVFHFASW